MKNLSKFISIFVIICIAVLGILYINNDIGIRANKLEEDIRKSQKINDDWTVSGQVSSSMAGFISYDEEKFDHTFSVYVNYPGISFGYFFRGGGSLSGIENSVGEFTVEGIEERVFISMNKSNICKAHIDDGNDSVIGIDSEKPFAIVLPINSGKVTFYDVDGNVVEYRSQPL